MTILYDTWQQHSSWRWWQFLKSLNSNDTFLAIICCFSPTKLLSDPLSSSSLFFSLNEWKKHKRCSNYYDLLCFFLLSLFLFTLFFFFFFNVFHYCIDSPLITVSWTLHMLHPSLILHSFFTHSLLILNLLHLNYNWLQIQKTTRDQWRHQRRALKESSSSPRIEGKA